MTTIQDRLLEARGDGMEEQKEELPDPALVVSAATAAAAGGGVPVGGPLAPSSRAAMIPGKPEPLSPDKVGDEHGFRAQLEGLAKAVFGGCGSVMDFFVPDKSRTAPHPAGYPPAHAAHAAAHYPPAPGASPYGGAGGGVYPSTMPPQPPVPHPHDPIAAAYGPHYGPLHHAPDPALHPAHHSPYHAHPMMMPPGAYPHAPPHYPPYAPQLVYNQEPAPALSIAEELRQLALQQQAPQIHPEFAAPRDIPKFLGEEAGFDDDNISAISQHTLEEMARRNARIAAANANAANQNNAQRAGTVAPAPGTLHPLSQSQQSQQGPASSSASYGPTAVEAAAPTRRPSSHSAPPTTTRTTTAAPMTTDRPPSPTRTQSLSTSTPPSTNNTNMNNNNNTNLKNPPSNNNDNDKTVSL